MPIRILQDPENLEGLYIKTETMLESKVLMEAISGISKRVKGTPADGKIELSIGEEVFYMMNLPNIH